MKAALDPLRAWFAGNGWVPFGYQEAVWAAYLAGESGLLHAPTGSGKTLAVFGGPVLERLAEGTDGEGTEARRHEGTKGKKRWSAGEGFTLLWLTPMRALANDTAHNLAAAVEGVGLDWSVQLRTSDTSAYTRKRQRDRLPTVLVTTPESLSLLLSYPDARQKMAGLKAVVADEWHELLSTKRGVQAELGIARLRAWNPGVRTWGLSATLGNLEESMRVLLGSGAAAGRLVHAPSDKHIGVESLLPESIERFPWGGHMGLRMAQQVAAVLDEARTSLLFTNTRAQAEIWFKTLMQLRPELVGAIAIHHGSLDRKIRNEVEKLVRAGKLKAVVCTSSLDLGVDFAAVDQVIQVGSPKGVGRLMQRAGRSGHRPGVPSRVVCVPTHALELVEFSAARAGIEARAVESREPLAKPLDVLVQHVVTVAAGGGFTEAALLAEVRTTHAYCDLSDEEWRWAMDFAVRGGPSLTAYPRFARIRRDDSTGDWVVADDRLARTHRQGIGTIAGDGVVQIVTTGGKRLGTIEESFISKLNPGDFFVFAGRPLEFLGVREMRARVRLTRRRQGIVPSWAGGRFPLSTKLAQGVRRRLDEAGRGEFTDAEMRCVAPLLAVQAASSRIPRPGELLIENIGTREGRHHFLYPFLGRLVHEGLGALLSYRIGRRFTQPVTATFTDYGIELLCPAALPLDESAWRGLLSPAELVEDLLACLNTGELTKRQFREISRVAGLVLTSSPAAPRSNRQLQASAGLFFEVFTEFDPQNLLLVQAKREVLERQLEFGRLKAALEGLAAQALVLRSPGRLTPMAFPVWAQRIQSQTIRMEDATTRIERMARQLEAAS